MSADRELLELAAKAAGIELAWSSMENVPPRRVDDDSWHNWDPLTDDGDAMRLAVNLRLSFVHEKHEVMVRDYTGHYLAGPKWIVERFDPDGAKATRRAIVRAAAEIGKAMP